MFTDEIREQYRVVTTSYGNGESEETIPLGSWRKGGGLAGTRGHAYIKGKDMAGIWLKARSAKAAMEAILPLAASAKIMQAADGEFTFSCPMSGCEVKE